MPSRIGLVLGVLVAGAPVARAFEVARARISATASQPKAGPEKVLDPFLSTAWCGPAGARLTIELDRPLPVDRVVVEVGPGAVSVTVDAEPPATTPSERTRDWIAFARPLAPMSKLAIALGDRPGCVAGIHLQRGKEDHSLVRFLDGPRLDALVATLPRVRAALSACDEKGLGELALFPVRWLEVATGASPRRRAYRDAAALVAGCRASEAWKGEIFGVADQGPGEATLLGAEGDFTLVWRKDRWRLVALPDVNL